MPYFLSTDVVLHLPVSRCFLQEKEQYKAAAFLHKLHKTASSFHSLRFLSRILHFIDMDIDLIITQVKMDTWPICPATPKSSLQFTRLLQTGNSQSSWCTEHRGALNIILNKCSFTQGRGISCVQMQSALVALLQRCFSTAKPQALKSGCRSFKS